MHVYRTCTSTVHAFKATQKSQYETVSNHVSVDKMLRFVLLIAAAGVIHAQGTLIATMEVQGILINHPWHGTYIRW